MPDARVSGRRARRFERDRDEQGRPANARPRDRLGRPLPRGADPELTITEAEFDDLEDALAAAVSLWNQERFFESHELLEDVWQAAPDDDRLFWQGVIQVAVGCCHHQRGNVRGAVALLGKAADKLRGYPDVYYGVDVEQLRVFAEGTAAAIDDAQEIFDIGYLEFPAMDDGPWFHRDPRGHTEVHAR
jgi:predicted metal-dependent hydrolase